MHHHIEPTNTTEIHWQYGVRMDNTLILTTPDYEEAQAAFDHARHKKAERIELMRRPSNPWQVMETYTRVPTHTNGN